jgi:hypothetical protein
MNEPLRKTLALPNDIKTYFYCGHGSDICNPETNEVVTHIVPDNCIYVTLAECGLPTYTDVIRNGTLGSRDSSTFFKYPYVTLFKEKLARLLNINVNSITVRLPGQTYAASYFFPVSYWYQGNTKGIRYSGLCEKADLEMNNAMVNYSDFPLEAGNPFPVINKENIISKFAASSYPTMDRVRRVIDTAIANEPLKFSDTYRPGSLGQGYQYLVGITRKIEEEYGYFSGISTEDGPDAFFSNTYLMEKFPGIHYNIICRVVTCDNHPAPPEVFMRRRRNSFVQQDVIRPQITNANFIWSILDKIDRVENDEFKDEVDRLRAVIDFKADNPHP